MIPVSPTKSTNSAPVPLPPSLRPRRRRLPPAIEREHPSNLLSRGDVRHFVDACDLVERQCAYELELRRRHGEPVCHPDDPDGLGAYASQARRARELYTRVLRDAHARAMAELRAGGLHEFAGALETGSYWRLAL